MPISERIRRAGWRRLPVVGLPPGGLLLVALLVTAGLAGGAIAPPPVLAVNDDGQADLGLLRQFHSYAPARRLASPGAREKRQARARLMGAARAAWRRGDYARARKLFRQAFKAGELTAGWYLGYLYRSGRGGKVDHGKAFTYYRALAKRYDADERNLRRLMLTVDALVRVADYYRTGIGRKREKRDLRRAFRLYSMAATHNHPGAFHGMALVALASKGRVARKRWVVGWLKRAAINGHAEAAAKLALLAEQGMPGLVRPDPVAARAWRLIAMRLRGPAVRAAKLAPAARDGGARALTAEQEAQAQRLVQRFFAGMRGGMSPRLDLPRPPTAAVSAPR